MKKQIKTIIFDIGGVLVDLDFKRTFDAFSESGFKNLEKMISQQESTNILSQYKLGLISSEDFKNYIRSELGPQISDEKIESMWNKMLIKIPHEKLDFLLELHQKYKLFALSNTNELHWRYASQMFNYQKYTIDNFFDRIFLSFQMHKAKPNSDIYEEMIRQTNLNPSESLFIDDSEENCKTAASLGMNYHVYKIGENLSLIKNILE